MDRRTYVLGCTGLLVGLAGCSAGDSDGTESDAPSGGDGDVPPQVEVVRRYYRALDDGDIAAARRLHADGAGGPTPSEESADSLRETDIFVTNTSLQTVDGDAATVATTLSVAPPESGDTRATDLVVELRRTDAGWRIRNSRLADSGTIVRETVESATPQQVSNRLDIVSAVGTDIADGSVRRVEIVVKRAPGSSDVDLSGAVAQWTDDSGTYDLVFGGATAADSFSIESVQDPDGSLSGATPVLNDPTDRATLVFETGTFRESGLRAGSSIEVQLVTQSGGTTALILNVPQSLDGAKAVSL